MGFFKRFYDFAVNIFLLPIFDAPEQKPLHLPPHVGRPSSVPSCVNSPQNRSCWVPGFDINTDYELPTGIPPGVLREVSLEISMRTSIDDDLINT